VKIRLLRFVPLIALATSLGACSSGFEAKWQAAGRRPAPDPYSGRWAGEWRSTRGTHHDRLECVFTRDKPAHYTADFHAHWHGLSSSYTVGFTTTPARDGLHFRGEQDLGALQGGVYKYDGLVTPEKFRAHYDSRYDTGVFELQRVAPQRVATDCFPARR
jgi:hypothetical protein